MSETMVIPEYLCNCCARPVLEWLLAEIRREFGEAADRYAYDISRSNDEAWDLGQVAAWLLAERTWERDEARQWADRLRRDVLLFRAVPPLPWDDER